jgi:gliding motility-associated-like protein
MKLMIYDMSKITSYVLLLVCLFSVQLHAQLSNFTLNVSKTDETCRGNGSLTVSATGTTPNAILVYKIYKLPETTNPYSILTTTNYLGGLVAGNYKVVAIQSFNSLQNTQEKTVSIINSIGTFSFSVSSLNHNCSSGGAIVLTAASGTIAQCEIISGTVTRPLQASTTFDNLPGGTYNIRAFNECGVGKVKTFTLSVINSTLNISDPVYVEMQNAICDSIKVMNTISASSGPINYPLTVKHTLSIMGLDGSALEINQYFETGNENALEVSAIVPRFLTDSYTYEVSVTDNCNASYMKGDNVVDPSLALSLSMGEAKCAEKFLILNASKYLGSYTVNFLSYPDGFNPQDYIATPQGPFTEASVSYGDATHSVPFGTYEVEITDLCGRTAVESILIEFIKPSPSGSGRNNGCFSDFGSLTIQVPPQKIVSATLMTVTLLNPNATYSATLPQNINFSITPQGAIKLLDLPLGTYTIIFTDDCGFEYEKTVVVPRYTDQGYNIAALPSCADNFGSIRFRSGNGDITSAKIIAAPAAFTQTLPYDVTSSLNSEGDLYLNNLPEGTYTFEGTDVCAVTALKEVNVEGYTRPVNPYEFTPKCGTFTVKVTDTSNGLEGATYWLQKYFPATDSWGHPQSGGTYTEGTEPANTNAIRLYNNTVKSNLAYTGKFRVVKKFESFGNGTKANVICVETYTPFDYTDVLAINTAYTMACQGQPNDVTLEVVGFPTKFRIKSKNGVNMNFDNGSSNVFHNLDAAEYVFAVEDGCGNVVTQGYNVQELPSISEAQQPADLVNCTDAGQPDNNVFNLTDLNATILGPLYSSMYTITYHLTAEDADAGINALPTTYTSSINGQEIFIRLVNNVVTICHDSSKSIRLFSGDTQTVGIQTLGTICDGKELALTATAGFDSYLWSNGETTRTIKVTQPGTYTVEVTRSYGTTYCTGTTSVEIEESFTPNIKSIETSDWTIDENTITVHTQEDGEYLYSVDGFDYQEDNMFTNLKPGIYTVHVKDKAGCGESIEEVVLMNYPNYFTPNGDGQHEKWHIKYSFMEPHFTVAIFDRYGKLITTLSATSDGWDGTLNGIQLPSTDYWFVVNREDGRQLRGHFAMLR